MMTQEQINKKLEQFHKQRQKRKEEEFKKIIEIRRSTFWTAFLDVKDPVALQRSRRDD